MTGPRDEELAAILEARADRLPGSVARAVMAAVREEIGTPKGGALFSVVPVTRARGMNRPAGWAAIGLAAALVLAVVGGGRLPDPSMPAGSGTGTGSPASSTGPTGEPAATVMLPATKTITAGELRAGLDDRSLYGQIVLLTGSPRVREFPCDRPDPCRFIEIVGLDGVMVEDRSGSAEDVLARVNARPGDALLALRVDVSGLELLGWVTTRVQVALTVNGLASQFSALGTGDLVVVSGWLIPPPTAAECPPPRDPNTPCGRTTPLLSDAPPTPDGEFVYAEALNVGLDPAVRFRPDDAALTGPFLVRYMAYRGGSLPPYQVVARLDPATTMRVVPEPAAAALTVEQFRAAIEDGSLDGRMVLVTGTLQATIASPCPNDGTLGCLSLSIPGLDGVDVRWDGSVGAWLAAGATGAPLPPQVAGTLVVTPSFGSLDVLGRLLGNLERPSSLQDLANSTLVNRLDPFVLTPVAGWLVVGGIQPCRAPAPDATPCPGPDPFLTDVEPSPDGRVTNYDREQQVRVWPGAVGIDAAQVVTQGPFLCRVSVSGCGPTCDFATQLPRWEVMARYDAGDIVRVVMP